MKEVVVFVLDDSWESRVQEVGDPYKVGDCVRPCHLKADKIPMIIEEIISGPERRYRLYDAGRIIDEEEVAAWIPPLWHWAYMGYFDMLLGIPEAERLQPITIGEALSVHLEDGRDAILYDWTVTSERSYYGYGFLDGRPSEFVRPYRASIWRFVKWMS